MGGMESTTIVLPSAPADIRRPPLPLLAAVVPVAAGIVLWLVTGSLFALCFAALGPLMLVASYVDGLRTRLRERRRGREESDAAWERAETELERLHAQEHADAWRREPGVVQSLQDPPLRSGEAPDQRTLVVLGRGVRPSAVQARGGDDDRSRAFRTRARELGDAPVSVPLGRGICVRAAGPVAEAVARAIVVQLCLRFGPSLLGISGEAISVWGLSGYPHVGRRRAAFRLALGEGDGRTDATICIRMPGEEPPEGVTTVLDCSVPACSRMRTPDGDRELAVEALSAQQARIIGADLAARADTETAIPDRIGLDELGAADAGGLAAAIGRGERGDLSVSLVEDGPHAIVTGMTGTGKSELLTSWITALTATHSPEELAFVLVDFKGGTAFDPLRRLPHVVAVITDLDAEGARRGVGSLTAELRRREAALGRAGVRDVEECAELSRLVIVIDEFAALLQEHPDLGAVFTDVAARGRALGMHLVLGTQRASGVIRDALAANCPLRISLRVAEPADSRFVIGSDAAAELPGGTESRGLAFVRRPRDNRAELARIALTADADIEAAARRWGGHRAQPSPWLPQLPSRLELPADELSAGVVLGRADEPDRQRQPWLRLAEGDGLAVIGGPGSGKSTAVAMLAAQLPDAVVIPQDPEQAWDAVAQLCTGAHGPVLCDDLDLLAAKYPPDYAQVFTNRWELIVRAASTTVITMSRVSGPVGRLIDAVPRRALLRLTSKVEHIAAGGEPSAFDRGRLAGRAWVDGLEVQLCLPAAGAQLDQRTSESCEWQPRLARTGIITPAVAATAAVLASAHPGHRVMSLRDLAPGAPAAEDAVIVVGDPEEWRAQWTLLQGIRTTGELVVAAECATELRQLAGVRELPPYAQLHADRAWSVQAGSQPQRVLLS